MFGQVSGCGRAGTRLWWGRCRAVGGKWRAVTGQVHSRDKAGVGLWQGRCRVVVGEVQSYVRAGRGLCGRADAGLWWHRFWAVTRQIWSCGSAGAGLWWGRCRAVVGQVQGTLKAHIRSNNIVLGS